MRNSSSEDFQSALTARSPSPIVSPMHAATFDQAVAQILQRKPTFDALAYYFLKDALDFTLHRKAAANGGKPGHVSGQELLAGFRDHALEQFGPMAHTLLTEWGVSRCEDVGEMVFDLISAEVFGKQDSDKPEDFSAIFDFEEALTRPFRATQSAGVASRGKPGPRRRVS